MSSALVGDLNRLVYYFGLPALLFSETSRLELVQLVDATTALAYPIVVTLTAGVALGVSVLLPYAQRGPVAQAAFRADLGYLGLAVVTTILDRGALAYAAIIIAVGAIMNSLLSIFVLSLLHPNAAHLPVRKRVFQVILNPLLIAIASGLTVSFLGWDVPQLVRHTMDLLARMSLPLILLVLGLSVSFSDLCRNLPSAIFASIVKLIVMPVLAWSTMRFILQGPDLLLQTTVLMAAMPSAATSQAFAKAFNADESVSASSVGLTTSLAIVSIPLTAVLLGL